MSGFDPIYDDALDRGDACELDRLLHPSQAFDRPADVVNDPDRAALSRRWRVAAPPRGESLQWIAASSVCFRLRGRVGWGCALLCCQPSPSSSPRKRKGGGTGVRAS